ncbi:ATP-dependent nuclease [Chromobacterium phragmitis]|uniref:ATP-dependent endonuclease n=1 Tax=Chromobacterium phragmitis TaxID=2202141 RepID=A0A344UJM0_9NEIS|nr:AAA family ATPase [Chromobacterium phragmitis]AXE35468.1 ATP-dependent endonuclease [Chromobacterium phragmitis]
MHLARLVIKNFRKLSHAELTFQPGLNVLVGGNNVGKTAVVDALRALLAGHDEPYPRLSEEDVHRPHGGTPSGDIVFEYVFSGLSLDDEADFLAALVPDAAGGLEAHIKIRYSDPDKGGRLRAKRWCGEHEDVGLTTDMMENLRGVYLPPLRDASQGLKPGRTSQLARLLQLLADDEGIKGINKALQDLDGELKAHLPIANTHEAINTRHKTMLGPHLAQLLEVGLSASDFKSLKSRLSLVVDALEIEQNGLGFNNLIYMAVVLSELTKNPDSCYRGLIVEEPEAHLHPQLQAVLLQYLQSIQAVDGEKPVQLFVTSHSPNFASIADLNSLVCLVDTGAAVETFLPRSVTFKKGKREKLERYLDVTRAELFFARRVIFVEGAAELMMVDVLAKRMGYDLRQHGVSLISVEGLNFDSFLPLFGGKALKIPVAVLTDADPVPPKADPAAVAESAFPTPAASAIVVTAPGAVPADAEELEEEEEEDDDVEPVYPASGDTIIVSANTAKMKTCEDAHVKVFHGLKTFEYDLALEADNRKAMLKALAELRPRIAKSLANTVAAEVGDAAQAKALFCGMFERKQNNVQKGSFAQSLAQVISDETVAFKVPAYIEAAIQHVCQMAEAPRP